jgi:carboxyl-terminal processing protease
MTLLVTTLMTADLRQRQKRNGTVQHSPHIKPTKAAKSSSILLAGLLVSGLPIEHSIAAINPDKPPSDSNVPQSSPTDTAPLPIDAMRRFVDVYQKVRMNYVEPVSDDVLFDNALRGLLSNLDPYSDFLDAQTYNAIVDFTDGELGQTGLVVQPATTTADPTQGGDKLTPVGMQSSAPQWQITSVPKGSPAAKAGIQVGDLLLKIDGKSVKSLSQSDIEQMLRGPRNSFVRLTVMQSGKHAREVRVLLAIPEDNAVKALIQPDGIVALQIRAFQTQTGTQITDVLDPIYKEGKLNGIVLDLRDNPGGLLTSAIDVANFFLNEGIIVYTQGRGEPEKFYRVLTTERYPNIAVSILINHYSASAAEVLTGALRDHNRATVYGFTSYGKGSVQRIWPIGQGRAIKMTIARYFTPNGRMIEGVGITPDVFIPEAETKPVRSNGMTIDPKDTALLRIAVAMHEQLNLGQSTTEPPQGATAKPTSTTSRTPPPATHSKNLIEPKPTTVAKAKVSENTE